MPLVFVHGVKNRIGSGYQEATAAREALFRRFALAGLCPHPDRATVLSPYWGGHAAEFAWDLACLPEDDAESLGAADSDPEVSPLAAALRAHAGQQAAPDRILAAAAGADFPGTIDLLFAAGAVEADADAAEFAEAAARAAAYADAHPVGPAWLAEAATDDDFLDRLENDIENTTATMPTGAGGQAAEGFEALGVRDLMGAVRAGADRLHAAVGSAVGAPVYELMRRHVVPTAATFFGDVFVYLDRRGTPADPGDIPTVVLDGLRKAAAAVDEEDPYLIVVGHSLGGVITYDLLTSFATDLHVDAFVTVGSQVGLFEELKLFRISDPKVPSNGQTRVARPPEVDHWVNVFDLNDLFSYRLEPIVDGVDEFRYATGQLLTAHGAYFGQPRFHERLAERLRTLLRP